MRIVASDRDLNIADALGEPGDFVQVYLEASLSVAGYLLHGPSSEVLYLAVHQGSGDAPERSGGGKGLAQKCLGWETVIPLHSVLLVRHVDGRPTGCACHGMLEARS